MTIRSYLNKHWFYCSAVIASFLLTVLTGPVYAEQSQQWDKDKWLKERFGVQHEKLIPIVAVADMYFSCQLEKTANSQVTVKALITEVDKTELAQRLLACLEGASPKSDIALNYGLLGCFHEQLADLPASDRQQKMKLVQQAIASLSREERQKSFTQCVTDQAINYLQ